MNILSRPAISDRDGGSFFISYRYHDGGGMKEEPPRRRLHLTATEAKQENPTILFGQPHHITCSYIATIDYLSLRGVQSEELTDLYLSSQCTW